MGNDFDNRVFLLSLLSKGEIHELEDRMNGVAKYVTSVAQSGWIRALLNSGLFQYPMRNKHKIGVAICLAQGMCGV
jgi:hypothetical protein